MPERHEYFIRPVHTQGRCKNLGCPDPIGFELIYIFQRGGDPDSGRRSWFLCYRHAQGSAQVRGLDFPYTPPDFTPLADPLSTDADIDSQPTPDSRFRRLLGIARPAGWRRRL